MIPVRSPLRNRSFLSLPRLLLASALVWSLPETKAVFGVHPGLGVLVVLGILGI